MWSYKSSIFSSLDSQKYIVYSLAKDDIIFIPLYKSGHGGAVIYFKESLSSHRSIKITCFNQDGTRANHDFIFDDDLDVLKLKSVLKAKELGWDIKDIKRGE